MEIKLVVEKGSPKQQVIYLHRALTIVGRQKGCHLRIPSPQVSRRHCRLSVRDDCLVMEDLDSANGSFVNGVRIAGKQFVRPGDQLEIGPLAFRVEYPLTQTAIDRLLKEQESGEVEAATVAVDDDRPVDSVDTDTDVVIVAPEDEAVAVELAEDEAPASATNDEPPVKFDEEDAWRLPVGEDVRDILSKIDKPGK